jgi:hypothetical protein
MSQAQARAIYVRSQMLGEDAGSHAPDDVVKRLVAVQTQYAVSLPVALAARSKLTKTFCEAAFNKKPSLYKAWTLRSTLHVHHLEDRPLLLNAVALARYRRYQGWMTGKSLTREDLEARETRILEALSKKPLTRPELHDLVPELKGLAYAGWGADVMGLSFKGEVILAPAGPGATRFALSRQWLGCDDCPELEGALPELLRRYLASHAPATVADFAYWAGIYQTSAKRAFEELKGELVPVEVEGLEGTRYLLGSQSVEQEPLRGLRLLAKFDPLLMGHKDKRLVLPEKLKPRVFRKAGQVEATVLIHGEVAAAWRLDRGGRSSSITVEPFRKLGPRAMGQIEKQARRLVRPLALGDVNVKLLET